MNAVGIIPARHASTRFPGKPLARIAGVPMVQRVYERVREAKGLADVYVATDSDLIADACRGFGAPVIMTRDDHPTGTDRLAEAARGLDADVIVNVQGDEPLIEGFVVDAALEALLGDDDADMSTVVHRLEGDAREDPNRVKVVLDRRSFALYFSRSPIPYRRGAPVRGQEDAATWQHVGVYCYRRGFLLEFVDLPRTPAEQAEELEQLRALEHGFAIRAAIVEGWSSTPVDVPEDVARVEAILAKGGARSET
jgi:3-deoxy-manno-octulosonate cytidylyltransferase (CMP-KDO synthetase)